MMFMADRGDRCHVAGCGPWVKTAKMLVSALAETIAAEDRAADRRRTGAFSGLKNAASAPEHARVPHLTLLCSRSPSILSVKKTSESRSNSNRTIVMEGA
jgi:hypothetical protein